VDVSTVAVSAIGALPTSFMQSNTQFTSYMTDEVSKIKQKKIIVDGAANTVTTINADNDSSSNQMSDNELLNSLMPNANSLGGPLIFMGMSTFRFYSYLDQNQSSTAQTLAINFSLKTVVLLMYTIALLLLLIANVVRVAFLWIFIIASPFIILFKIFNDDKMP